MSAKGPDTPFLATAPPAWAARALAWLLLALFAVGSTTLVLVRVPERVVTPFVLVAVEGVSPVRALHRGTVTVVAVSDTQVIEAGTTMFVVRSDAVADRSTERDMLATSLSGREARIGNEQQRYSNQRRADEQEAEGLARRLSALNARAVIAERQAVLAREVARREQRSHEEGLTSWVEASRPRLESDRLEAELEGIKGEIAEASAAVAGIRYRMASSRAAFDEVIRGVTEEFDRARTRKDALDGEASSTGGTLAVAAPCAGTVVRLAVRSPGVVVTESDLLAEIACRGVALQAELLVPQRGFARLQPGQTVTLRYDAFPHERYGVRFATLGWISPASTVSEDVPFRALAHLDEQAVPVDGAPRDVLPGMGGQASILIGRRTLLSYVLEPVRALRNATVAERPRPEGGP